MQMPSLHPLEYRGGPKERAINSMVLEDILDLVVIEEVVERDIIHDMELKRRKERTRWK